MSETREIFTQRRKGVSQKEVRVKQHNEERKGKRHDLLLKRRIPADAESDEEPEESVKSTPLEEKEEPAKSTAWDKSEQRRQQLLEWQAKRKAMKSEVAKSKKAVVVGSKQPVLHLMPLSNVPVPQPAMDVEKCDTTNSTHVKNSTGLNTEQQKVSATKRVTRSQKGAAEKPTDAPVPPKTLRENAPSDRKLTATKQKVSSAPEEKHVPKAKPPTRIGQTVTSKENATDKKAAGPVRGKNKDAIKKKVDEKKVCVVEKKVVVEKKEGGIEKKVVVEKKEGGIEKKVGAAERKRGAVEKGVDVAEKKGKVASKRPVANGTEKPGSKAAGKGQIRTQPKKEHTESINKNITLQSENTTLSCTDSSDNTCVQLPINDSIEESSSIHATTRDENQVPDLAWIPGSRATPKIKQATNFRDAFGDSPLHSFSPFRFTGAKTPRGTQEEGGRCEFMFSKTLPSNPQEFVAGMGAESSHSDMESDSLMEHEGADDDCGDERVNGERVGRKCGDEGKEESIIKDGHNVASVVDVHKLESIEDGHKEESVEDPDEKSDGPKEKCHKAADEKQSVIDGSTEGRGENDHAKSNAEDGSQSRCDHTNQEEAVIASFRKLHSDVVEKLTNLCQLWEQKCPTLTIPEDQQEEVLGQIRTTVCQAQLLMRQKLKQYIGLVGQAEHGGGEQPTKVEDLQGFWDMVYFQVEDIVKKFQGLEDLEKNNWQMEQALEPATKKRKKCAIPPPGATATKASLNEKQLAAREKREAARLKIKELKAMAVSKKEQDERGDDVQSNVDGTQSTGNDATAEHTTPSCADNKVEPSCDGVKSTSTGTAPGSAQCQVNEPLVSLLDFDTLVPTPKHIKFPSCPSVPLSPESSLQTMVSPLPAALLRTPKKAADVPTAQLLSFTPARATPATPGKMESCEGAFQKMYVAVTPSKKLREARPELTGDDVVMCEARRSVRLAHKSSCTPSRQVVVSSLAELPGDLDFSYCPPSQL